MIISKLSKTAYKTADPSNRLTGDWKNIDPVFAGRLAYLCAMELTESYRPTARQTELYNQYLEYKRTGEGTIKSAARPGQSWHEFRLAIDTSSKPIRGMTNEELAPYGLCKPIAKEGWHVQPIETAKLGTKANTGAAQKLYPLVISTEVEKMLDRIKKVLTVNDEISLATQLEAQQKTPMWWIIHQLLSKLGA